MITNYYKISHFPVKVSNTRCSSTTLKQFQILDALPKLIKLKSWAAYTCGFW